MHTHLHTDTLSHTYAHNSHTDTLSHTHTLAHTFTHKDTHTYLHIHSHRDTLSVMHTHMYTHSLTETHSHTRTRTYTHMPPWSSLSVVHAITYPRACSKLCTSDQASSQSALLQTRFLRPREKWRILPKKIVEKTTPTVRGFLSK